jgi:hypothetical protein
MDVTDKEIEQIRIAYAKGTRARVLAGKYGMSVSGIWCICAGERHKEANGPTRKPLRFRADERTM